MPSTCPAVRYTVVVSTYSPLLRVSLCKKNCLGSVSALDKTTLKCVSGWFGGKVQEQVSHQLSESDQCSNAMGLKSLAPVGTANFGINVAEISLQDCGSVLCRKRWSRAAAMASRFDSSSSWSTSKVMPSEEPFPGFSFLTVFLKNFDRDVQRLCSRLEITSPLCSVSKSSPLFHVVLVRARTLQSSSQRAVATPFRVDQTSSTS